MSSDSSPEVSVSDPYAAMPDWASDYYESITSNAMTADKDSAALAEQYSNPDALIADYAGQPLVDDMLGSTGSAIDANNAAYASALANTQAAADKAGGVYDSSIKGMQGLDADLASISTNLGRAFDTSGAQDALTGMDYTAVQQSYEDPYIDAVVDPTLERMAEEQARALAEMEMAAAAVGGGTNSRMGVATAVSNDEYMRSAAEMEAQMRSDALRAGQELGLEQTSQMSANEQAAANLGLTESELEADIRERAALLGISQAQARADILSGTTDMAAEQFGISDTVSTREQEVGSAGLVGAELGMSASEIALAEAERARAIQQEKMQAPLTMQTWLRDQQATPLAAPLPEVTTTTTTPAEASTFSQILGAAASLGGAYLSDERAKTDIVPLTGALDMIRAQRPSIYAYLDPAHDRIPEPGRRSAGLMAQDLERIPGAVHVGADGYRRVDPYPVLATIAAAVRELDDRVSKIGGLAHG